MTETRRRKSENRRRKNVLFFVLFSLLFVFCPLSSVFCQGEEEGKMKVKSNDFEHNKMLDAKFTCQGQNISPQLIFENVPEGTKSLALSVVDPDAPGGSFVHWLVSNIPAGTKEIVQGAPLSSGSTEIINDFGKREYGGPCPPSGTHRYFFTVYALDADNLQGLSKSNFTNEVKGHTIETAEIIGLYKKK